MIIRDRSAGVHGASGLHRGGALAVRHSQEVGRPEIGPFFGEVEKLSILVTLLIGEKPDLNQIKNQRNLAPYKELATVGAWFLRDD